MVLFCRCVLSFCQIDPDIVTAVIYRMGHKSNTNGVIINSFNLKEVYMSRIN